MFTNNHIQVIFIRAFINLLTGNLSGVNKLIQARALQETPLFSQPGLTVNLTLIDDVYYITFPFGEEHIKFRLDKHATVTKRTVNNINVWFHRSARTLHAEAIKIVEDAISEINVLSDIKEINLISRLTSRPVHKRLRTGLWSVTDLLCPAVVIKRGLFDLKVKVTTHPPVAFGLLQSLTSIHPGIIKEFNAGKDQSSVNRWLREALLAHVNETLK